MDDTQRAAIAQQLTGETLDSLTLGEAMDFEEKSGLTLASLQRNTIPPMRALVAIIWVLGRRNDPAFTFDQAKEVRFSDINFEAAPTTGSTPSPN